MLPTRLPVYRETQPTNLNPNDPEYVDWLISRGVRVNASYLDAEGKLWTSRHA